MFFRLHHQIIHRSSVAGNTYSRHSVVGGPETVKKGVADFIARYRPDEVIVVTQVFDAAARARSFEILSAAVAQ